MLMTNYFSLPSSENVLISFSFLGDFFSLLIQDSDLIALCFFISVFEKCHATSFSLSGFCWETLIAYFSQLLRLCLSFWKLHCNVGRRGFFWVYLIWELFSFLESVGFLLLNMRHFQTLFLYVLLQSCFLTFFLLGCQGHNY